MGFLHLPKAVRNDSHANLAAGPDEEPVLLTKHATCAIVGLVNDMSASPLISKPLPAAAGQSVAAGEGHGIPKRQERLLLTAILILAALLRLGWLGIAQFSADEAGIVCLALELAEGRSLPLFGTGTSFGLPTPPLCEHLYALPARVSSNPFWLTFFTASLNVLAVVLCWRLSRRYWGWQVAACATLLFATNPWAVFFSRKIWQPDLMPLFALAWAITGEMAFRERRRGAVALHLVLLSIVAQVHYSGLALVPVTAVLLIWDRRHVNRRMLMVGMLAAGLIGARFVYSLLRTEATGLAAGLQFITGPAKMDGTSLRLWWIAATGMDVHSLAGYPGYQAFLRTLPDVDALRWVLGALVLAGLGLWLWESLKCRPSSSTSAGTLTSLWALAPLLLLVRHSKPLYLHYYVVAIPALCLAAGFALGRALAARHSALRLGAAGLTVALAVAQTATFLATLRFVGTVATPGGFGVPLQSQLRASTRATALGQPVIILADGVDRRMSSWAAVFDVLLHDVPHRVLDGTRLGLFPSADSTVIITPGATAARQAYAQAGLLDSAEVISNRDGEEPFLVLQLEGGYAPGLQAAADPRRLAHGAEVVGYRAEGVLQAGTALGWWLAWRVWDKRADPAKQYQIFNRLVDVRGSYVAQADGPVIPASDWVVGDLVVQHFRMELPAQVQSGPLWMRVGMYTYPEIQNQTVLDANGQPAGEFVALGPLTGD